MRKNSETFSYPIEDESRKLGNENDKNRTRYRNNVSMPKEFLPTFIDWLAIHLGIDIAIEWLYVIELLLAIGIFIIISYVSFIMIDLVNKIPIIRRMMIQEIILRNMFIK